MIRATFRPDGFTIQGHADLAPHGKDILCAAVSMGAQMVAVGVTESLRARVKVKRRSGELSIKLKDPDIPGAQVLIESLRLTLLKLERQFPDRIVVSR